MQIGASDLGRLKQEISQTLGDEFVAELMHFNLAGFVAEDGRKRENREQISESARQQLIAHPLASWLQNFEYDLQKSAALGMLNISETSARLLNFSANLIDGRRIDNFHLMIPRFRQRTEFRSTAYELHVACQYLSLGYSVSFVLPIKDKKTPDLIVEKNGYVVQVECKSTEDETDFQHNLFIQNAVRMDKTMERIGLNLFIKIHPRLPLTGKHIERLFAEIDSELLKAERRTLYLGGAVSVEWSEVDTNKILALTEPNDVQLVSSNFNARKSDRLDSGFVSFNGVQEANGKVAWNLERGSEIRHYFEEDIFQSIKSKLRKANSQLLADIPAVIHIEVPCKTTASFLQIIDRNFDLTRDRVNIFRKIRAVVLECSTIDLHMEDGGRPVSILTYVISNPFAEAPFPRELQIAGTKDLGLQINMAEGTVAIEIAKPKDPQVFLSRPLFIHSAPHGDEQIIIWLKDKNTLRCEVISSDGRRQIAERHVQWQEVPEEFQVIASWGLRELSLYIGAIKPINLGPPEFFLSNEQSRGVSGL